MKGSLNADADCSEASHLPHSSLSEMLLTQGRTADSDVPELNCSWREMMLRVHRDSEWRPPVLLGPAMYTIRIVIAGYLTDFHRLINDTRPLPG
jgi:hypothetical protein